MTGSIFLLGIFAVSIVSLAVRAISEEDRAARRGAAAETGRPARESENDRAMRG